MGTLQLQVIGDSQRVYSASPERPATAEDYARVTRPFGPDRPIVTDEPPLKRIKDKHHNLARLIASGLYSQQDASIMAGYRPGSATRLMSDPTFRELVQFYRTDNQRIARGTIERLAGVGADALDVIEERLENPETRVKIPTSELRAIAEMALDRTGYGPQSTQTNVNVHVGLADKLEAARRRAQQSAGLVIEAKVVNG